MLTKIKEKAKKFWKWILITIFGLGIAVAAILPSEPSIEPIQFDWQNASALEDISQRTHITKDFQDPNNPNQRILIQSSGLLHYHDGEEFKDLKSLPFPEGKEITAPAERHFMLDLPTWGEVKVENNGKQVRVYDKLGQPIYVFIDPLVIEKGKAPFDVKDNLGKKIRDAFSREDLQPYEIDYHIEKNSEVDECEFEVENNKLYFKLPETLKNTYPLQAYDDTDTSSTNNRDAYIWDSSVNGNSGGTTNLYTLYQGASAQDSYRAVMDWTLSSGSGTITAVKLYLYSNALFGAGTLNLYELTTAFPSETAVTWNCAQDDNLDGTCDIDWTTDGGDFDSGTVVDSIACVALNNWGYFDLGPGATNPIPGLTWGSNKDLIIKVDSETGSSDIGNNFGPKEGASNNPYIEITYTPPSVGRRTIIE